MAAVPMTRLLPRSRSARVTRAVICSLLFMMAALVVAETFGLRLAADKHRAAASRVENVTLGDAVDQVSAATSQRSDQCMGVVTIRGGDQQPDGTMICKYDDGTEVITRFTHGAFAFRRPPSGSSCYFTVYVEGASQGEECEYDSDTVGAASIIMEKACVVSGKYLSADNTPKANAILVALPVLSRSGSPMVEWNDVRRETIRTGADGEFTFSHLVCGESFSINELSASEGLVRLTEDVQPGEVTAALVLRE